MDILSDDTLPEGVKRPYLRFLVWVYLKSCPCDTNFNSAVTSLVHDAYVLCLDSSSIVYHRIILSTQCVGAMLWSVVQLRRGQLWMLVDVVGSC